MQMNHERLRPGSGANNIALDQDRPEMIDLLRARDRVYRRAKLCQGLFVASTAALGVIGVFSNTELKPYFGLAGMLAFVLDVCFLEKHQKELCKLGARLGEDFDIQVLKLQRNPFVTEIPVSPEDVHEYASTRLTPERENQLRSWYEPVVARVPLPIGRLICQRLNVSYDAALRRKYGQGLLLVALAVVILILGIPEHRDR